MNFRIVTQISSGLINFYLLVGFPFSYLTEGPDGSDESDKAWWVSKWSHRIKGNGVAPLHILTPCSLHLLLFLQNLCSLLWFAQKSLHRGSGREWGGTGNVNCHFISMHAVHCIFTFVSFLSLAPPPLPRIYITLSLSPPPPSLVLIS